MARRPVVTEEDLRAYLASGVDPSRAGGTLRVVVDRDSIVTPAALDFAKERGIEVVRGYRAVGPGGRPGGPVAGDRAGDRLVDRVVAAVVRRLGPDAPRDAVAEAAARVLERLGYTVRGR